MSPRAKSQRGRRDEPDETATAVEIDADRDTVWKRVSDPACYPEFMANLERWDAATEGATVSGPDTRCI